MLQAIADLLSLIVRPCYDLTGNWWIAILLFTLATKVILLPLSLWCQKNSIVMVTLMPDLNRIKLVHYGDRETIGEKQSALYKERHYHPLASLIPLAIQVIILFGLVDVIHSITDHGAPGTEFLGLVPTVDGGLSWLMPLLAGASAVIMGFAQNRINPLQKEQSTAEKNLTNALSIALSLFLGVFVAAGMCFYWVVSNLSSIAIQALCNLLVKPAKYIDYDALASSREELAQLDALDAGRAKKWYQHDPLASREKADYKRFFHTVGKHLVFFSEGSGFYKYFAGSIDWLLANSDVTIHYVTNDPDDQVFSLAKTQPRLCPYYIGQKRTITLLMKMDADVVVLTQEDLDNYYNKRSYVRRDIEYVFMFHHMTSTHLTALKHAYDHYDTLLCVGPHQIAELRRAEELYGLPARNLVECGYTLLDQDIAAYEALDNVASTGMQTEACLSNRPTVLIAPSWQEGCIPDSCIDPLLEGLLGRGWRVIVRPHPEYVKRYRPRWEALLARYANVPEDELFFEHDFSKNDTVFTSSVLITDWSSIACEFSFSTGKPSIFIDTPMKVGNPFWEELDIVPTDISLRNEIGISLPLNDLSTLGDTVAQMLAHPERWQKQIETVRDGFIFNLRHSDEAAGEYLLSTMLDAQARKKEVRNA